VARSDIFPQVKMVISAQRLRRFLEHRLVRVLLKNVGVFFWNSQELSLLPWRIPIAYWALYNIKVHNYNKSTGRDS